MNDRFKFRGMTLGGEWVYGNLAIISEKIKSCGMTIDAGYYISNKVGMPFAYPVRPETLGQCTGLKDKNGKLIYEGDILDNISIDEQYEVRWDEDTARFCCITDNEIYDFDNFDVTAFEVIGNIHENADLLENETKDYRKVCRGCCRGK